MIKTKSFFGILPIYSVVVGWAKKTAHPTFKSKSKSQKVGDLYEKLKGRLIA